MAGRGLRERDCGLGLIAIVPGRAWLARSVQDLS